MTDPVLIARRECVGGPLDGKIMAVYATQQALAASDDGRWLLYHLRGGKFYYGRLEPSDWHPRKKPE